MTANGLQRQLDHKIDGQLKYAYSDLFQVQLHYTVAHSQVTELACMLELLANAVKAEMKEKSADGFVVNILNKPVRFGEDDVNQLVEIFKTFKQNN